MAHRPNDAMWKQYARTLNSDEFGKFPELSWHETPVGMAYFAGRQIADKVWVRSTDIMAPNIHSLTSVFETGTTVKECSPPWLTIWTVPIDDGSCMNFCLCHLPESDTMPDEARTTLLTSPDRLLMDAPELRLDMPDAVRFLSGLRRRVDAPDALCAG